MGTINFMGSYSGIDSSVVDQLIEAEKAKGVKFTNQKTKIEGEKNAWKDVNTRLDSLFKKLGTLQEKETFFSRTVSSNLTVSTALSVSATDDAATGEYRIHIEQLAQSSRMTGAKVVGAEESIYDELGLANTEFTFTVDEGTAYTVSLTAKDSLKDVTNKINEQTEKSGIKASVVDNRLILTDTQMGSRNLEVGGSAAAELGFTGNKALEFSAGQSAIFTLDGLTIERDSNSIDDVIEGLIFNLTNIHEGAETEVITVSADTEKTVETIQEFVEQYNSVMSFLDQQMDVGTPSAEDNQAGTLTGDGTAMRLQSGLRSLMTRPIEGSDTGDILSVEDIGITIDRDGQATLDQEVLRSVLKEDPVNVSRFFYNEERVEAPVEGEERPTSKLQKNGLTELLRNFVDTYISSGTGIITNKAGTYDRMLKDINEQIEVFNNRIDRKRDRYIQQFTALDTAMMQAESQMSYLYSQLGMAQE